MAVTHAGAAALVEQQAPDAADDVKAAACVALGVWLDANADAVHDTQVGDQRATMKRNGNAMVMSGAGEMLAPFRVIRGRRIPA